MRARALVLGLGAGVLGGFVLLSWGVAMPWLGPAAIVVGALAPPRPFGLAGALIGWGGLWVLLFLRAASASDPSSSSGPGIAPWLAVAVGVVAAGFVVALAAVRLTGHAPAGES